MVYFIFIQSALNGTVIDVLAAFSAWNSLLCCTLVMAVRKPADGKSVLCHIAFVIVSFALYFDVRRIEVEYNIVCLLHEVFGVR